MALYGDGHPARERAVDVAYAALADLQAAEPRPTFTFLGAEVVCGQRPLREVRDWEWSARLSEAGVQRLEFDTEVGRDDFAAFLDDVHARLAGSAASSAELRPLRHAAIRYGNVGVRGEAAAARTDGSAAPAGFTLGVEADAVRWLHDEVQGRKRLHLAEAEAVVRSLSLAMHADQQMMLPLMRLRRFDEYTTTHSMNVAVLTMAFAEFLGLDGRDVRAFGVAGLLHDIGKVNVPAEILTKPGPLTPEERVLINRHPVDGARIILETEEHLELAAVVAFEHHIMIDGRGYPELHFPRDCHYASRLVHLCDVYDALRTRRPYRDAWAAEHVLDYISGHSGMEFDRELAGGFVRMMRLWEEREEQEPEPVGLAAAAQAITLNEGSSHVI
jgi:putative nucleotidyltransferase with HDIG domain